MSRLKDRDFYAEWDEDTQLYGVFGTESGFCYATYSNPSEAEETAKQMRKDHG